MRLEDVRNLPESPGVYIFKASGKPIYIGKAKNLKKRVLQHMSRRNEKSAIVVDEADSLDFVQTSNEREALILEANLIYSHKPKYNVMLKGTEPYPYVRISDGPFPYVEVVRRKFGGGTFFGPFTNVKFLRSLLDVLQKFFRFRTCKKDLEKVKKPCMDYHIGLCMGPCTGTVSEEEYNGMIEKLKDFFRGNVRELMDFIKEKMEHHAGMLDFETAAKFRDVLMGMENILQKQGVVLEDGRNLDVVVGKDGMFVVLRIRGGFLMGKLVYEMKGGDVKDFVEHFYTVEAERPGKIVVGDPFETPLDVEISPPGDPNEEHLLRIARENLENEIRIAGIRSEQLRRLAEFVGLVRAPRRIEGVDVSHLMGRGTVASVVVFIDGKPEKTQYRRYRLSDGKVDDYRAIKDVVIRRYSKHDVPDILLIDGGIGQVRAAIHGLKKVGKETVVLGLAKSEERVVTPEGEYLLPKDSPVLRALVSIRDEAHRFALESSRRIRERESLRSVLDSVEGIGPVRKRRIIEKFGSLENLRKASVEEIAEVVGSRSLAERIVKLV